jgi:hypothetical protein
MQEDFEDFVALSRHFSADGPSFAWVDSKNPDVYGQFTLCHCSFKSVTELE